MGGEKTPTNKYIHNHDNITTKNKHKNINKHNKQQINQYIIIITNKVCK